MRLRLRRLLVRRLLLLRGRLRNPSVTLPTASRTLLLCRLLRHRGPTLRPRQLRVPSMRFLRRLLRLLLRCPRVRHWLVELRLRRQPVRCLLVLRREPSRRPISAVCWGPRLQRLLARRLPVLPLLPLRGRLRNPSVTLPTASRTLRPPRRLRFPRLRQPVRCLLVLRREPSRRPISAVCSGPRLQLPHRSRSPSVPLPTAS
jgi:hypothetical protein